MLIYCSHYKTNLLTEAECYYCAREKTYSCDSMGEPTDEKPKNIKAIFEPNARCHPVVFPGKSDII